MTLNGLPVSRINIAPARPNIQAGSTPPMEEISYGSKPYESDINVIRARTENIESVYQSSIPVLNQFLTILGDKTNQSFANQEEAFKNKVTTIALGLIELKSKVKVSDEESAVIDQFIEELFTAGNFTEKLHRVNESNESEELIKAYLYNFKDYSERVFTWLNEQDVFQRHCRISEAIKRTADQQHSSSPQESPVHAGEIRAIERLQSEPFHSIDGSLKLEEEEGIKDLKVITFPTEKKFIGTIDKDEDEGNGFYISTINSPVNIRGGQRFFQPGKKRVDLHDLSTLGKRQSGEIDIELPIEITGNGSDSCVILPTKIGYRAVAISFEGSDGKEVEAYQNDLGVTILKNLNPNIKKVKYRLVKSESKIEDIPKEWLLHFPVKNQSQVSSLLQSALKSCKSREAFIGILSAHLSDSNPVYSMDPSIQEITRRAENYFEVQEAIGYIGHCVDDSLILCNKVRGYGIPALIGGGFVVGKAEDGRYAFQADTGHAKLIFFDEHGVPKEFESTLINSKDHVLDSEKVERDLPLVVPVIENGSESEIDRTLKAHSPSWKKKREESERSPLESIGTGEYAETLRREYEDIRREDRSSHKSDVHFDAYKTALELEKLLKSWDTILGNNNIKEIVELSLAIDSKKKYLSNYIRSLQKTGEIPLELARFLREINNKDIIGITKKHLSSLEASASSVQILRLIKEHSHDWSFCRTYGEILFNLVDPEKLSEISLSEAKEISFNLLAFDTSNGNEKKISEILLSLKDKIYYENNHIFHLQTRISTTSKSNDEMALGNYLKLLETIPNQEKHIINLFIELAREKDKTPMENLLKALSKNESFKKYTEERDGRIIPSELLKRCIGERCKKGLFKSQIVDLAGNRSHGRSITKESVPFNNLIEEKIVYQDDMFEITSHDFETEQYHWSFHSDIKTLISNFEDLGISLKEYISKEEAERILEKDFLTPPTFWRNASSQEKERFYRNRDRLACFNEDGSLDLSRPCLALDRGLSELESPELKNALYFIKYFGLEIEKPPTSEEEIWNSKLKPKIERREISFSLEDLPKDVILEVLSSNDEHKELLDLFGCEWEIKGEKAKILKSLFEKIPGAKELILSHCCITTERVHSFLYEKTISQSTQYRFNIINNMLQKRDDFSNLKEELASLLKNNNLTPSEKAKKVRELLIPRNSKELYFHELRNELSTLNDREVLILALRVSRGLPITHSEPKVSKPSKKFDLSGISKTLVEILPTLMKIPPIPNTGHIKSEISSIEREIEDPEPSYTPKNKGLNILSKISSVKTKSYWVERLVESIKELKQADVINFLSESGPYFEEACRIASAPIQGKIYSEEPIFKNGHVSFIRRTGPSKIYGKSNSGEFHTHREYVAGDDVRQINWKVYGKTDDYVVKESRESNDPAPYHYIVDIEWLINNSGGRISPNIEKLISILKKNLSKRQAQHLHFYYRGEIIEPLSLNPKEISRLLSSEKISDEFGERTHLVDFILNLNLLGHVAKARRSTEQSSKYQYAGKSISNNLWIPPSREGTAIILSDNDKEIQSSTPLFDHWIRRHIDVRIARFS